MKKAIEIQSEIDKTDSRIAELQTQFDEQTATFETVQQAFIAGKSDINQLHAEQSKLTLFSQAIEALKATFEKLKSAFETQSGEERRAELLREMTTTANAVQAGVNEYLETRSEFHAVVSDYAEKLIKQASAYRSKQAEYQSIVEELKPTGAEIQGIEQKTRTMAEARYFNHESTGTFHEAVALAENLLAAKLSKAAQAKRIAAHHARTMERQTRFSVNNQ